MATMNGAAHRDTDRTRARYAAAHADLRKTQSEMTPAVIEEMFDSHDQHPLDVVARSAHDELDAATAAARASGWLLR